MTKLSKTLLKASFAGTYAENMLLPIWAGFTEKVGGTLLDAGIGFAIYSMVVGLMTVTLGSRPWFNLHKRAIVFFGFLMAGCGDMSYILVSNKWELFAVQGFIGIATGLLTPAWDGLYSEDDADNKTKLWSFCTGGLSFFVGLSAITGALMATYFGFHSLFVVMGLMNLIAVYFCWRVWREPVCASA
jgi:predicted MFS family arabinose efflux permease